jgi:hypothetical protein
MWEEFNTQEIIFQCWRIFCAQIEWLTIEYLFSISAYIKLFTWLNYVKIPEKKTNLIFCNIMLSDNTLYDNIQYVIRYHLIILYCIFSDKVMITDDVQKITYNNILQRRHISWSSPFQKPLRRWKRFSNLMGRDPLKKCPSAQLASNKKSFDTTFTPCYLSLGSH